MSLYGYSFVYLCNSMFVSLEQPATLRVPLHLHSSPLPCPQSAPGVSALVAQPWLRYCLQDNTNWAPCLYPKAQVGFFWALLARPVLDRRELLLYYCSCFPCNYIALPMLPCFTLFTLQCDSASRRLSLISSSSVFQCCIFLDCMERSHYFGKNNFSCVVYCPASLSATLLPRQEHAVQVHSFPCSCLCWLEKPSFL